MGPMKRLSALALLMLLLAADSPADACDCLRLQPLSAAVRKEAAFIFEGKAVEIVERSLHTLRSTSGGGSSESTRMGREVVFEVTRVWNGVTTKRLTVSAQISDCMFPFEIDHTYVRRVRLEGREGCAGDEHLQPNDRSEQSRPADRATRDGQRSQVSIIRRGRRRGSRHSSRSATIGFTRLAQGDTYQTGVDYLSLSQTKMIRSRMANKRGVTLSFFEAPFASLLAPRELHRHRPRQTGALHVVHRRASKVVECGRRVARVGPGPPARLMRRPWR